MVHVFSKDLANSTIINNLQQQITDLQNQLNECCEEIDELASEAGSEASEEVPPPPTCDPNNLDISYVFPNEIETTDNVNELGYKTWLNYDTPRVEVTSYHLLPATLESDTSKVLIFGFHCIDDYDDLPSEIVFMENVKFVKNNNNLEINGVPVISKNEVDTIKAVHQYIPAIVTENKLIINNVDIPITIDWSNALKFYITFYSTATAFFGMSMDFDVDLQMPTNYGISNETISSLLDGVNCKFYKVEVTVG